MISAVVIACLVFAVGCAAFAFAQARRSENGPADQAGSGGLQFAAISVAVLLLVLAAAVALIDDKVAEPADAGGAEPAQAVPESASASADAPLIYPVSAEELDNFAGSMQGTYSQGSEPLCLVQYYDRDVMVGAGRSYKWWTSCDEADDLETVAEVRNRLALPPAWGERNAVAVACIPARAAVAYISGPAAAVRRDGRRYSGGGIQYRVLNFNPTWIVSRESLPAASTPLPALDRRSCPR